MSVDVSVRVMVGQIRRKDLCDGLGFDHNFDLTLPCRVALSMGLSWGRKIGRATAESKRAMDESTGSEWTRARGVNGREHGE